MKQHRIIRTAGTAILAGALGLGTGLGMTGAQAGHASRVEAPVWLHVAQAPAAVAHAACGRRHGQAAEVWAAGKDGVVVCRSGRVAAP